MDDFVTVFGAVEALTAAQVVLSLVMSFVLSSVFAHVYTKTFRGFSYSLSFVHTMILASMIVSLMIMAIGNNLARGLGIFGTLAIIRFRTPIRDPRDMVFLFASLAVGIACGAHVFSVAVSGTVVISLAALMLHASPFASRRRYEGLLRFTIPSGNSAEQAVRTVFHQCCSSVELLGMREAAQGDLIEYSYHVRLIDPSYQTELLNGIHAVEGVEDANLLMHRITVEI